MAKKSLIAESGVVRRDTGAAITRAATGAAGRARSSRSSGSAGSACGKLAHEGAIPGMTKSSW